MFRFCLIVWYNHPLSIIRIKIIPHVTGIYLIFLFILQTIVHKITKVWQFKLNSYKHIRL